MSLSQLLRPDAVLAALRVNGKKQALQEMSERAALVSGLPAREIFDAILQRERLGSTRSWRRRRHSAWQAGEMPADFRRLCTA